MKKMSAAKLISSLLCLGLISITLSGCSKVINLEIANHTAQEIRVDWLTDRYNGAQYVIGNVKPNSRVMFEAGLPDGGDYILLFYDVKTGGLLKTLNADNTTVHSRLEHNTWTVTIRRNKEIQW